MNRPATEGTLAAAATRLGSVSESTEVGVLSLQAARARAARAVPRTFLYMRLRSFGAGEKLATMDAGSRWAKRVRTESPVEKFPDADEATREWPLDLLQLLPGGSLLHQGPDLPESTGIGPGSPGSGGGVQSTQASLTPSIEVAAIARSWLPSGPAEEIVVPVNRS